MVVKLEAIWGDLRKSIPINESAEEQKRYAFEVFDVVAKNDISTFKGMFFSLKDAKVETVKDFIFDYDNKKLYELFTS